MPIKKYEWEEITEAYIEGHIKLGKKHVHGLKKRLAEQYNIPYVNVVKHSNNHKWKRKVQSALNNMKAMGLPTEPAMQLLNSTIKEAVAEASGKPLTKAEKKDLVVVDPEGPIKPLLDEISIREENFKMATVATGKLFKIIVDTTEAELKKALSLKDSFLLFKYMAQLRLESAGVGSTFDFTQINNYGPMQVNAQYPKTVEDHREETTKMRRMANLFNEFLIEDEKTIQH